MLKAQTDIVLLKRALKEVRGYSLSLLSMSVLSFLASPLKVLTPVPLSIVLDSVIGDKPLPAAISAFFPDAMSDSKTAVFTFALALMAAVAVAGQLQGFGFALLRSYTGDRMVLGFRAKLFGHVQRLSLSYHDKRGTADSVYRLQNDAVALQYLTIDGIIPMATAVVTLGAMLLVTLKIDVELTLVALVVTPVLYLISRMMRPVLRSKSRELKKLDSSTQSIAQEVLGVVRVVKAFGRENDEQQRYLNRGADGMRARLRMNIFEGGYSLLVGLTTTLGTAAVLWIGVRHIQDGTLTVGQLLLVLSYVGQLYDPLKTIGRKAATLQGHLTSLERAFALLDELPEVLERPNAKTIVRARGDVRFENVCFSYDGAQNVLQGVNLSVSKGARVGIRGKTGAGKSTLLSLLMRFYDVTGGRILLDGVDLRDYKVADLRNQFAMVLQDSVLFSTTIARNIAYARPSATEEEIVHAARLANAHDFIVALANGYDTLVGERGMSLSGGERQRIALARAFLKDAPILILDEPTSAVDLQTERAIIEALQRLMEGRTTFMIAHRLSTLEHCEVRLELRDHQLINLQEELTLER